MRILVVTQYFWPENFRINDLVSEFVQRGHEIVVLTGLPNYPSGRLLPEFASDRPAYSEYSGARVVRMPLVTRGRGRGLRLIANYLSFALSASSLGIWRLRGYRPDVIFVFEPSPITVGLPAILLGRLKNVPVALWVLDLWPDTLVALGVVKSRRLLAAIGRLVSLIYDHCALILVQSRAFVPVVLQNSRRANAAERIKYFPNWSESIFNTSGSDPASEIPWRPDLFTIVFAGNVGEAQDFPAILRAAERVKDDGRIRWVVVGDGRASRWVANEVARRGLQATVILAGRYPLGRMPSFFRHAKALLVTLRPDPVFSMTIPGKVQSYLAVGVPILAMLDGEGARVIEESNGGLVCAAGDSEGLATLALEMAALSEEERRAMGRRAVTYALREFDRDELLSRLESAFAEMSICSVDRSDLSGRGVSQGTTASRPHASDS